MPEQPMDGQQLVAALWKEMLRTMGELSGERPVFEPFETEHGLGYRWTCKLPDRSELCA